MSPVLNCSKINIYEVVNLSKRWKVIENHWVFNIKSNSHYKSWLVAKRFSQVKEINFDKLFSLVVCYKMAYLFLAITALKDWDIYSIDVKTTYLYGNLNKEIYIEQSKDFRFSNKKRKSNNSTKHYTLSKLAYLGGRLWLS